MNCKKCNQHVIVENLGEGKRKVKCEACGTSEILDDKNRKYLTSDMPAHTKTLLG